MYGTYSRTTRPGWLEYSRHTSTSCYPAASSRHACSTRVCTVAMVPPPARRKLCHEAVMFAHAADRSKRARTHGCTAILPRCFLS